MAATNGSEQRSKIAEGSPAWRASYSSLEIPSFWVKNSTGDFIIPLACAFIPSLRFSICKIQDGLVRPPESHIFFKQFLGDRVRLFSDGDSW
jgi:hypothetical protein